jgi:hypothetical protein
MSERISALEMAVGFELGAYDRGSSMTGWIRKSWRATVSRDRCWS